MKVAGIVCEFNPYHKGHKYLIDHVRADIKPDAVVCVMSGDFVQRGFPAMWDKYTRAKLAVSQGVDLVIELPTRYAITAAPEFAKGGVSILKKLGCITHLVFGSECGDLKALQEAMEVEKDPAFAEKLQDFLDSGMSYPSAYAKASGNHLFDEPNNTLAIEYLRENKKQHAGFTPYTVKRFYGISAEEIRREIKARTIMRTNYPKADWDFQADERLFGVIRYMLLTKSAEELSDVLEVSEGIENKLKKAVLNANSFDELVQLTKSKRFTYAKISRILMQMLLGVTKKNAKSSQNMVKILAFNEKGKKVLREINKNGKLEFGATKFDANAHDIYNILTGKEIYSNSDYVINSKPFEK